MDGPCSQVKQDAETLTIRAAGIPRQGMNVFVVVYSPMVFYVSRRVLMSSYVFAMFPHVPISFPRFFFQIFFNHHVKYPQQIFKQPSTHPPITFKYLPNTWHKLQNSNNTHESWEWEWGMGMNVFSGKLKRSLKQPTPTMPNTLWEYWWEIFCRHCEHSKDRRK